MWKGEINWKVDVRVYCKPCKFCYTKPTLKTLQTLKLRKLWAVPNSSVWMEPGVHVSMMPDVSKSQDVIDWSLPQGQAPGVVSTYLAKNFWPPLLSPLPPRFSMLIPNSTNITAVLHHISSKDREWWVLNARNEARWREGTTKSTTGKDTVFENRGQPSAVSALQFRFGRTFTKQGRFCAANYEG